MKHDRPASSCSMVNDSHTAAPSAYSLRFTHLEHAVPVASGDTVFQSARRNGVRLVGACGGRGTCGTCSVRVIEGEFERNGPVANPAAAPAGRGTWERACQLRPLSNGSVEVAPRSLATVMRADVAAHGDAERLVASPMVTSVEVRLKRPSLDDPCADAQRLAQALCQTQPRLDLAALRQLPGVLRANAWSLRAHMRQDELIGVSAPGSPSLGLAVDLGTTNVAAFLIDLASGERLASLAIENPQAAWGADVISRVNHAAAHTNAADELRTAAVTALNALASDLCRTVGAVPADIVDVAVCGNTAMQHLLLGLPVGQLGRSPFVAALSQGVDVKARELGLVVCAGAYVHVAPGRRGVCRRRPCGCAARNTEDLGHRRHQSGDGHRHQHRDFADSRGPHLQRLVPVRAGARGRSHLLRHARSGRRDRARASRVGWRACRRRDRRHEAGRSVRLGRARRNGRLACHRHRRRPRAAERGARGRQ